MVWVEFPGRIRVLLDNPYVLQEFWLFQAGAMAEEKSGSVV